MGRSCEVLVFAMGFVCALLQAMKPLPIAEVMKLKMREDQSGSLSRRESKTFGTSKMKLPPYYHYGACPCAGGKAKGVKWLESCRGERGSYHLLSEVKHRWA